MAQKSAGPPGAVPAGPLDESRSPPSDQQPGTLNPDPNPTQAPTAVRPVYLVSLQPLAGVDGLRSLRAGLKTLLRRHGLKALDVRPVPPSAKVRR